MKILTLIDTLYPAGAETLAVSIAELLQAEGRYEPIVCATRSGGDLEAVLRKGGIRYLIVNRRSKLEMHKMRPVHDLLRRERVGIIHAHGVGSSIWGIILGSTARVPLIAHIHGGGPLVRWHQVADKFIGRMSKRVIAVSEYERRRLLAQGLRSDRVLAIANGIDIERFSVERTPDLKTRLGLPSDAPVVGICAALRAEKNHEMFLRAAARVVRGGTNARFVIVGGGGRIDILRTLSRDLGIGEQCVFTGSVTNVPELMATFDIGVLSSDREGLPLTILEYMASSLPVVATEIAAIPEAVEDGVNGFLVPRGDEVALAERIGRLLADTELARRLGGEGRRRVEASFSRRVMISRIQQVYDEMLDDENG